MEKATLKELTWLSPLPALMTAASGETVKNAADWAKRREEIYALAVGMQFGGMPPEPEFLEVEPLDRWDVGLNSVRIHTGRRDRPITFVMQVLLPKGIAAKPFPVVIDGDGCFQYPYKDAVVDMFRESGIAFVRFNRVELAHDIKEDVHTDGLYGVYPGMTFSAIAAWAWGYHRCVDAVLKLGIADPSLIAFTGHSRGGKVALLAGATDTRATVVNPNDSGAGGSGCYRIHSVTVCEDGTEKRSEQLSDLLKNFPFWFGPEMVPFAEREGELPFDQHMLKALVAPRILLDTDALSDAWANPAGTYLTHLAAKEAYSLLGAEENLMIHYRDGFHYHKVEDFAVLVNVIRHLRDGEALNSHINQPPFAGLSL